MEFRLLARASEAATTRARWANPFLRREDDVPAHTAWPAHGDGDEKRDGEISLELSRLIPGAAWRASGIYFPARELFIFRSCCTSIYEFAREATFILLSRVALDTHLEIPYFLPRQRSRFVSIAPARYYRRSRSSSLGGAALQLAHARYVE